MTKAICLYVTDVTGAPEFRRQAIAFSRIYGCEPRPFMAWDYVDVERYVSTCQSIELVAIFCHGFRSRLMTGHASDFRAKLPKYHDVDLLAQKIANASVPNVKVLLDACSTGSDSVGIDGDGGFADTLRDRLGVYGCIGGWIDAHNTSGNTATNPFVRRFYTDGDPNPSPGLGGAYIVAPREQPLWPKWDAALETEFRFRFPIMTVDAIRASL